MAKETKILRMTSCDLGEKQDVVLRVKWQIIGQLDRLNELGDPYTTAVSGESLLSQPAEGQTFTAYADLSEAQVISWISSSSEYIEKDAELDRKMAFENSPANVIKPLPWLA